MSGDETIASYRHVKFIAGQKVTIDITISKHIPSVIVSSTPPINTDVDSIPRPSVSATTH
jgi:hypothetical protein